MRDERVFASKQLTGPQIKFSGSKEEFVEMIREALYAAKICAYAQGFQLLRTASRNIGGV